MHRLKIPGKTGKILAFGVVAVLVILLVLGWRLGRDIEVTTEPKTATVVVGENIDVSAPGYVPYASPKRRSLFTGQKININLRPLPAPAIIDQASQLYSDRQGKIYFNSGQQFKSIEVIKKFNVLVNSGFDKLVNAAVSPDGALAWVKFQDGTNGIYDFARYTIVDQDFLRWQADVEVAAWLPNSSASDPEKQRLIFLKDGVLFQTDPRERQIERLLDLSPENIISGKLIWPADGKFMIIIANANLYLYEPQVKTLSRLAQGGVTAAAISPASDAVLFTQDSQLNYLKIGFIDPFSGQPGSRQVVVQPVKNLNISANANFGGFINNGKDFVALAEQKLLMIDLETGNKKSLWHENLPDDINQLATSNKNTYFIANNQLYYIEIDDGRY